MPILNITLKYSKIKPFFYPCDDPEWSNFTKYFASNFTRLGIKKLISTSYAKGAANKQPTLFELESPLYNPQQHATHGKLFTLTRDTDGNGTVDTDDIEFTGYLEGDGDFRSSEVKKLRDEADIIITNPPFSLFREFLAWVLEADKQFVIIGNINAITYKEVFPLLSDNKVWLGYSIHSGDRKFNVPDDYPLNAAGCGIDENGKKFIRVKGVRWFTNIDHGKRHENLILDTMEHNLKFNKKLKNKLEKEYGKLEYPHYDNYDAIEVPFTECIPSDYDGVMGVPITFIDKYNPDQFEVLGMTKTPICYDNADCAKRCKTYSNALQYKNDVYCGSGNKVNDGSVILSDNFVKDKTYYTAENVNGYLLAQYPRVLIRSRYQEVSRC